MSTTISGPLSSVRLDSRTTAIYKKLVKEIEGFVKDEKKQPSTTEVIKCCDNCHSNVSIYALINPVQPGGR